MATMAKTQTKKARTSKVQSSNGKIQRLSPEELAEYFVPATCKTPEENGRRSSAPPRVCASRPASRAACTGLGRPR